MCKTIYQNADTTENGQLLFHMFTNPTGLLWFAQWSWVITQTEELPLREWWWKLSTLKKHLWLCAVKTGSEFHSPGLRLSRSGIEPRKLQDFSQVSQVILRQVVLRSALRIKETFLFVPCFILVTTNIFYFHIIIFFYKTPLKFFWIALYNYNRICCDPWGILWDFIYFFGPSKWVGINEEY